MSDAAADKLVSALFAASADALAAGIAAERVARAMRLCADHTEALTSAAPTIADVIVAAVIEGKVSRKALLGPSHARANARPRQIAMTVAYEETGKSFSQVGRFFGGRDHSTVIHARRAVGDLVASGDLEVILLKNRIREASLRIARDRFKGEPHATH